jgi:phosphatidylinositol-3-phosphatase
MRRLGVILIGENKEHDQIIGSATAPYLNKLASEDASLAQMFAEERPSEGNYFWLFSGGNQGVGFFATKFRGQIDNDQFRRAADQERPVVRRRSVSEVDVTPPGCRYPCFYGRKRVPGISFANVPSG